jgi:hypothetical protein
MTTIETQIPEPVLQQAEELAAREHIPLEQLISLAVTRAIGTWNDENEIAMRAKRNGRERFLNALTEALNAESPDGDRLLRAI